MYAWFYSGSPLVVYPLVALFLFLGVFLSVLARTCLFQSASRYDAVASLPLVDQENHPETPEIHDRGAIQ